MADIHDDVPPQCNSRFAKQTVSVVPVHLLNIGMMSAMVNDEIFLTSCSRPEQ
jgi:hypothetical protein